VTSLQSCSCVAGDAALGNIYLYVTAEDACLRLRVDIPGHSMVASRSSLAIGPKLQPRATSAARTDNLSGQSYNADVATTSLDLPTLSSCTSVNASISAILPPAAPSLYVLNAAALSKPGAVDHLAADLKCCGSSVAVITETHFKQKHTDGVVTIDGFSLFRRDRVGRKGGGVALYVQSTNQSTVWCHPSPAAARTSYCGCVSA